ncbi:MAG: MFS transporter [Parachlamydia sp.]|nr:MFS transporter [Parachlamydia sp.]
MNMRKQALGLIILLGTVSFFADITYEGARSITGQYLALLGATATAIGIVSGFGELFGYGLRLISGLLTDKTQRYWTFAFIGYGINIVAMPLLALVSTWPMAAFLIILERSAKAIRNPARDAMISYGAKQVGSGWGFGLHAALDQSGAMLGPLLIALIYAWKESYRLGFACLAMPALLAMGVLYLARRMYPYPRKLEIEQEAIGTKGFDRRFWLYMAAMACIAAGYVDFALIAYHLQKTHQMPEAWIPLLYSGAMGAMALSGLGLGRLYDIYGGRVLLFSTCLSLFFVPLVFLGGPPWILAGMLLWGLGMGAQAGIMRAVIAELIGVDLRGTAYGIFNVIFGIAWFLGSALMGWLYDQSTSYLILFSCLSQAAALPFLIVTEKTAIG